MFCPAESPTDKIASRFSCSWTLAMLQILRYVHSHVDHMFGIRSTPPDPSCLIASPKSLMQQET